MAKKKIPTKKSRLKMELAARNGRKCALCGRRRDFDRLTIDHVVPVAAGGGLSIENSQLVCRRCNSRKADAVSWNSIPEVERSDVRLWREVCKILRGLPKREVISYRQIAMLLGEKSLAERIGRVLKEYSLEGGRAAGEVPLHKVLDDEGYIPRGLPDAKRREYMEKLREDGLAPSRHGRLLLKKWGE